MTIGGSPVVAGANATRTSANQARQGFLSKVNPTPDVMSGQSEVVVRVVHDDSLLMYETLLRQIPAPFLLSGYRQVIRIAASQSPGGRKNHFSVDETNVSRHHRSPTMPGRSSSGSRGMCIQQ